MPVAELGRGNAVYGVPHRGCWLSPAAEKQAFAWTGKSVATAVPLFTSLSSVRAFRISNSRFDPGKLAKGRSLFFFFLVGVGGEAREGLLASVRACTDLCHASLIFAKRRPSP